MSTLVMFLPLTKVDVEARMVHGVATAESPDRSGEICDYETTKPYFQSWSDDTRAVSGGKSLGAVRAMHGRIAAGKLTDIAFDDDNRRILVAAKIVDDAEWDKVLEGVYTGFSQGGRYVKRWNDEATGMTRYTAEPTEISLVDVPCLPGATFEVVKAGVVEKRAFATPRELGPSPSDAVQASTTEALAKAALAIVDAADRLQKAVDENVRLRVALDWVTPEIAKLNQRITAIEAQPLPARAALRAAPREWDGATGPALGGVDAAVKTLSDLPQHERTMALMKVSLANPAPATF